MTTGVDRLAHSGYVSRLQALNLMMLTAVWVVLTGLTLAAPPQPRFTTTGEWGYSVGMGYAPNKAAIWASKAGATATFTPNLDSPGTVRVWFFVVAGTNNDPSVRFEIRHEGQTDTKFVDTSQGPARWEDLGTYRFRAGGDDYVRALKTGDRTVLRATAMKFEVLDPGQSGHILNTITIDDLVPYDPAALAGDQRAFDDVKGNWVEPFAVKVASRGWLPVSGSKFQPDGPITKGEFVKSLGRVIGKGLKATTPGDSMSPAEMLDLAVYAAKQSGKSLAFAGSLEGNTTEVAQRLQLTSGPGDPVLQGSAASRAQAAAILARLDGAVMQSFAPTDWQLAFSDEFAGQAVDESKWSIYNDDAFDGIQSSRWKSNVDQGDGYLRLLNKKESRKGKAWTTGMLETKTFRQKYGYFEARMKLAPSTGLNQAFWLRPKVGVKAPDHFEIDILEGHYPNVLNTTLHQQGVESLPKSSRAGIDMSLDFHTYAASWNEREIVFYLDGREIDRKPNTKANLECVVLLSTAVVGWAGPVTDRINGTSMLVDWVRVYAKP